MIDGSKFEFMRQPDIYSLFVNILDNAIDAVEKIEDCEKRVISLTAEETAGMIFLNAENYFDGKITIVENLPETTNSDKNFHGFGMKSIEHIIKKYKGELYVKADIAIFPRIILSKHIMDTWQKCAGLDFPNQMTNLAIYSDEDGIHFINYLKSYGRGYEGIMQTIKTSYMVFSNRYKSEKDVKVKQKYAWHLSYLNRCLLECEM